MNRKGLSPEFRATRLWRGKEKGPLWRFSAYFAAFKAKKGPEKSAGNPGYQWYARKSGKSLAQIQEAQNDPP